MENFKTVNKNTNATYFLNEDELINFFKKNRVQNYSITNLTKQKRTRTNKMLDVVVHLSISRSFNISCINLHSKLLI